MFEKLKSFLADDAFFYTIVILLVAGISFGLGRHSVGQKMAQNSSPGVVLHESTEVVTDEVKVEQATVVGSRSGTKYHLLDCPGAQQMKEENKVYFESVDMAEAAGYTPAANCPGLQ